MITTTYCEARTTPAGLLNQNCVVLQQQQTLKWQQAACQALWNLMAHET